MTTSWRFSGPLWRWEARPAVHFVSVPEDISDEILDLPLPPTRMGSVRIDVRCGSSHWSTSLFPDSTAGCYLLPIKAEVRSAEGLAEGAVAEISLSVAGSEATR